MTDINVGDVVRVTIEGKVRSTTGEDIQLGRGAGFAVFRKEPSDYTVTVEKVEPPVEVFGPGDIVRGKASGYVFTVLKDGKYANHFGSVYGHDGDEFTSRNYERVTL